MVFDDVILDMLNNKNLMQPIVTELFFSVRKLNISLICITRFYFDVPKIVRLNSTHYFIMKIPNKRQIQQIAANHSSEINFKDFINLCKRSTVEAMIRLLDQIILYVLDVILWKEFKN